MKDEGKILTIKMFEDVKLEVKIVAHTLETIKENTEKDLILFAVQEINSEKPKGNKSHYEYIVN